MGGESRRREWKEDKGRREGEEGSKKVERAAFEGRPILLFWRHIHCSSISTLTIIIPLSPTPIFLRPFPSPSSSYFSFPYLPLPILLFSCPFYQFHLFPPFVPSFTLYIPILVPFLSCSLSLPLSSSTFMFCLLF